MKREGWKVFSASALGAGLGAFVALEVVAWLWWVGLIVGGLVGYLSYEFKAVLAALPKAYRAARGWQTPPLYWANVAWLYLVLLSFVLWCVAFLAAIIVLGGTSGGHTHEVYGYSLLMIGVALIFFPATMAVVASEAGEGNAQRKDADRTRRIVYYILPPLVVFWHLPRGLWWAIRRTPRAVAVVAVTIGRGLFAFIRFVPRFGWQVFIRVHSEMRILCGTDAALGAAVGYFAGSALIGAIVGGLFGVVNYAFVTERWLRPRGYLPAQVE